MWHTIECLLPNVHWWNSQTRGVPNAEAGTRDFLGKELKELEELYSDNAKEFKALKTTAKEGNASLQH